MGEFLFKVSLACLSDEKQGLLTWADKETKTVKRKGIGVERTFSALKSLGEQRAKLSELCHKLAQQVETENLSGRNVTIKVILSHIKIY